VPALGGGSEAIKGMIVVGQSLVGSYQIANPMVVEERSFVWEDVNLRHSLSIHPMLAKNLLENGFSKMFEKQFFKHF
jgi:hypothetical protein